LTSSFNYDVTYTYTDSDVNGSESMIYPYKLHPGTGQGAGWFGPYGSDAAYPFGGYTQDATNNTFTWSGLINFSDLTGGGGGTPPATGGTPDAATGGTPSFALFGQGNNMNTTSAPKDQETSLTVKAVVVESDVTSTQNKVKKMQENATL
jgi:hypothetical protein